MPRPTDRLTLDAFLPYRLSYTAGLVSEAVAGAYRTLFGLGIPEWRIVAHVAGEPGISQQEIGRRTRMDKVTVSRATLALVARGLIDRNENPADRRSRRLMLTAEGERLYAAIAPKALELEAVMLTGLSAAEIAALRAMLARIDAAARTLGGADPAE